MHNKPCCLFPAAVSVHAELSSSSADSNVSTERMVVTQLESLGPPGALPKEAELSNVKEQLKRHLQRLGIDWGQFAVRVSNSIESYFLCESDQQLYQLRQHYESGLMKDVLERIFSLLAGERVNVGRLRWTTQEYEKCRQQFSALASKPRSQQLQALP